MATASFCVIPPLPLLSTRSADSTEVRAPDFNKAKRAHRHTRMHRESPPAGTQTCQTCARLFLHLFDLRRPFRSPPRRRLLMRMCPCERCVRVMRCLREHAHTGTQHPFHRSLGRHHRHTFFFFSGAGGGDRLACLSLTYRFFCSLHLLHFVRRGRTRGRIPRHKKRKRSAYRGV